MGTFHIEKDGITLLETNPRFLQGKLVDYNGFDFVGYDQAKQAILNWPVKKKLRISEFQGRAQEFVDIGNEETPTHKKCRFAALCYYDANDEIIGIFDEVFNNYFYRGAQKRISYEDFSALMLESGSN